MNASTSVAQAAKQLVSRRQNKLQGARLEESIRPTNIEEALAIQAAVTDMSGEVVAGWKCLLPLAEDQFIVAPILGEAIINQTVCPIITVAGCARFEPEIAFVLGADLPARAEDYSDQEIDDAIGHSHLALELIKGRFETSAEPDFYEKLADCLTNQGVYIGPEINKADAYQAATIAITVTQNQRKTNHDGKHPNGLPATPVYWLINYMSKRGISFSKGQAIITGSYAGVLEAELNAICEIEYAGLGNISIEFRAIE